MNGVDDLIGMVMDRINAHNADPKAIIWTPSANDILVKVNRTRKALNKLQTERRGPLDEENGKGRAALKASAFHTYCLMMTAPSR